jgi:hypothetical protein
MNGERERRTGTKVHLCGWDSGSHWHGPNELVLKQGLPYRFAEKLRGAGRLFCGKVQPGGFGHANSPFLVTIRDLGHAAIATIDLEDWDCPLVGILAVVPPAKFAQLPPEFAFEFASLVQFFHVLPPGSEGVLHDGLHAALEELDRGIPLVVSICPECLPAELEIPLSDLIERLAVTTLSWMAERDSQQAVAAFTKPESRREAPFAPVASAKRP